MEVTCKDEIPDYDGLIVGSPTYYGPMAFVFIAKTVQKDDADTKIGV